MPQLRSRQIESGPAWCRRCNAVCHVAIWESRYVRSWNELLSSSFDAAPARTARCAGCSTDRTAQGAAQRGAVQIPSPRDWDYSRRAGEQPPVGTG